MSHTHNGGRWSVRPSGPATPRSATPPTERGARTKPRTSSIVAGVAAFALAATGSVLASAPAQALPGAASTLVVHADQPFRPVTHVATGSLYGLASDTVPSDDLVQAIKPNTFVQMAPGGHQLPNGEPAPAGDALVVAPEAAKAGAKVVVRMSDWYPNFPYKWVSWTDWLNAVDTQVKSVQASGATNIAAYAALERAGLDVGHREGRLLQRCVGPHLPRGAIARPDHAHPGTELLRQHQRDAELPGERGGHEHGARHHRLARARELVAHPGRHRPR